MIQLEAPFTEEKIRALKQGDEVEITGVLFTGRDLPQIFTPRAAHCLTA